MAPTAAASQPAAATCDEAGQRTLLRRFFDGYNARDHALVLAAFGVEGALLGGAGLARAGLDYYDNVDGDAVQFQDEASLRRYLERRWALNDRFSVDLDAIALSARFPNPTFSFGRSSDQGTYAVNAKFVCSGGRFTGVVTSSVATSRTECPVTSAVPGSPRNANTAAFSRRWYASTDGRIWASRLDRFYVGENKVLWERPIGGGLVISGRPRDSTGPELTASVPAGYESSDFQASAIQFPVAGCWEVIGRSGSSELRYVVEVHPAGYIPVTGACADIAEAGAAARWVLTAEVESSRPDRPGFVEHQVIALRVWKGAATPTRPGVAAGSRIAVWQDVLFEPGLERGASYVLFLGVASFGSPNVQYGLTRILCPLRTIIEIIGGEARRPAAYSPEQWIWKGPQWTADLEHELAKLGS
jgi:hypothetical protein